MNFRKQDLETDTGSMECVLHRLGLL